MGLLKSAGEFLKELLDTHGRISVLSAYLIAIGGGTLVTGFLHVWTSLHGWFLAAAWLLVSGVFVFIAGTVAGKSTGAQGEQPTPALLADTSSIANSVKSLEDFYKQGLGGPFADELEAHFQRLAAFHTNPKEREKFLVRSLAAGGLSYLHDMTWSAIFKSQIEGSSD